MYTWQKRQRVRVGTSAEIVEDLAIVVATKPGTLVGEEGESESEGSLIQLWIYTPRLDHASGYIVPH